MRNAHERKTCCVCREKTVFVYGRCPSCFKAIDPVLFDRLKRLTRAERRVEFERATSQPERPRRSYENPAGEAELMKKAERAATRGTK
jgi:hypothetical protein